MLPGKKYTIADYEQIAWRRRWIIVIPFVLVAIGTAIVSATLPNRYRSSTTILIVPQQVPETFVQSTVNQRIEERLQMIHQQITSRTRLERIIQEFNLYEQERKSMIMEDVIERMRSQHIKVNIVQGRSRRDDASAFSLSFESNDARTAMLVTERLGALFIKENSTERANQAENTTTFMKGEMEEARRRLQEHELKLRAYRQQHGPSLPTQLQANLQAIQTTQQQILNKQTELSRETDRKAMIEGQVAALRIETSNVPAPRPPVASGDPAVVTGTATERLEGARATLKSMELRLTADHPDMRRVKKVIADLEKEAEKEALQRPISDTPQGPSQLPPAEVARRARIAELQSEYQSVNRRITDAQTEMQRLGDMVKVYQARVEATPERESELTALMRDYETLNVRYMDLLAKNEAAKASKNLEIQQIGEQFRILDGARLPEKPTSPDRLRMNLMGAAAGLALGIGLVVLLEYKDSSFKSESDVIVSLALPVLAMVPAIATKQEALSRRRRRLAFTAAGFVLVIGMAAAAAWKLHLIDGWVR